MMLTKMGCAAAIVLLLAGPAAAEKIDPIGDYTITFEREGWSESKTIAVQDFPTPEPFYTVNGKSVNVYVEHSGMYSGDEISGYNWYVNAPGVLKDPTNYSLLGGTGDLTITLSGLAFDGYFGPEIMFQPLVTHLYYVADDFSRKYVPGPVSDSDWQRTPIRPLDPGDPDYAVYGAAYGTPFQDASGPHVKFVLPDLYVPSGTIYELSFGAGFSVIPEPSVLVLMIVGLVGLWIHRNR